MDNGYYVRVRDWRRRPYSSTYNHGQLVYLLSPNCWFSCAYSTVIVMKNERMLDSRLLSGREYGSKICCSCWNHRHFWRWTWRVSHPAIGVPEFGKLPLVIQTKHHPVSDPTVHPRYKLLPKDVQHKDQHGVHDGLGIIIFHEAYQGPWEGLCLIHVLNQMLAVVDHRPQAFLAESPWEPGPNQRPIKNPRKKKSSWWIFGVRSLFGFEKGVSNLVLYILSIS